ncbi:hypothetical protein CMQ_3534 [Grosmannia clavigera kw1407]|uniref:Uncharacterized protein n=1 Tax=Grosmannia clavigera (strain kw1407 / UAMH 11150) TaxID=655863 RepID=F0X9U3_GROCL|nr:uncharacterized protein CMQ_3534 [Grosmannia clavigera kw1407]EFX05465.1 hypothetical protein CMQ_3534 [Grosmannia clavigera kw1407]
MNTSRDPTSRLRATLNPLRTSSLGVLHGTANTPLSALSIPSHGTLSVNQTPQSAIQPYNPQQWAPSPAPLDRGHHHFQDLQPQQSPPPPPPYSPPRSQRRPVSGIYETSSPANISAVRAPLPTGQRPSPEPFSGQQSFAPPPGTSRGGSRERRFGLPSFGRRRDATEQVTTIPPSDMHTLTHHAHIPPRPPPSLSPQPPPPPVLQPLQIPNDAIYGATVPPGSRRAASTGAIGTPTSARSRSSSQVRWESGMPIPPPPPGPPPSGSRSQSMNRAVMDPERVASPPTRRPPPTGVASLGPIPPTPAGWVDQEATSTPREPAQGHGAEGPRAQPAGLDYTPNRNSLGETASSANSSREMYESTASSNSSTSSPNAPHAGNNLARNGAVRGEKTLRERRNESRTRTSTRGSVDESSSSQRMSDIVIPSADSIGSLVRRPTINKSTPRSGGGLGSGRLTQFDGTPRTGDTLTGGSIPGTATPPFSPHPMKKRPTVSTPGLYAAGESPMQHAPPTPPSQSRSASKSTTRLQIDTTVAGADDHYSASQLISKETAVRQTGGQFSRGTVERFHQFAQREEAASSDAERVKLFAEFVVSESRIRRERYAAAIGVMGSEIFDLTRDLFRPMVDRRQSVVSQGSGGASAGVSAATSAVAFTPQTSEPSGSKRGSMNSVFRDSPSSAPITPGFSSIALEKAPVSAGMESIGSVGSSGPAMSPTVPPAGWQQSNYMPSLSPILSMSVSEHHDDNSSRGRTASRWWESSSYGGDGAGRLERSKRESKYMGVPKEAREALQWTDNPEPLSGNSLPGPADDAGLGIGGSSSSYYRAYENSSEYPLEKIPEPLHTPQAHVLNAQTSSPALTAPNTPSAAQLDVSRLVTLPPPYPRHHPALSNNHPELSSIRSAVRSLSSLAEVEGAKERFSRESQTARDEAARAAENQRQLMRANLQKEIATGHMSYAGAAAAEAEAAEGEKAQQKALNKAEFDRFQTTVVMPVNELVTGRVARATKLFDELRGRLFVETHEWDPNLPQEEGDEQPELLEKLTLLKWIFEAREMLHRANYDLLTDRNDRYRDMVLTPYRQSGNEEKLAEAEAFFADDVAKREHMFAVESLQRMQEFRDVIEENVLRGVEAQLSAFWDIAPPLGQLLEQIPGDLHGFAIRVPAAEYDETPSYRKHPLQYLFSLLLHAEKSTHQFIESQTNLLCLLHEVKEATVAAKARVAEPEGVQNAKQERARLTEDLQDKVRVVQDQWRAGLGDSIVLVKERVGGWLLETGGWDESLEDGGIGSV